MACSETIFVIFVLLLNLTFSAESLGDGLYPKQGKTSKQTKSVGKFSWHTSHSTKLNLFGFPCFSRLSIESVSQYRKFYNVTDLSRSYYYCSLY